VNPLHGPNERSSTEIRSRLTKLVVGTPGKKTRFHTRRGDLLEPKEWPAACTSLLRRVRGRTPDEPWLAPSAVRFLDRVIKRDWVVAELGAGASTTWFARRAGRVLSLEDDPEWAARIARNLDSLGITTVQLLLVDSAEFDETLARSATGMPIDLLLVDQTERQAGDRTESVRRGQSLVRPGGYLVLDDSDWPANQEVFRVLESWPRRRFVGIRPRPFQTTETTIFRRPVGL
jgi:hypothetical protein